MSALVAHDISHNNGTTHLELKGFIMSRKLTKATSGLIIAP